jgi:hypothetical protein
MKHFVFFLVKYFFISKIRVLILFFNLKFFILKLKKINQKSKFFLFYILMEI